LSRPETHLRVVVPIEEEEENEDFLNLRGFTAGLHPCQGAFAYWNIPDRVYVALQHVGLLGNNRGYTK
jgi:hypothetical protein